jgi:hypothetical protein
MLDGGGKAITQYFCEKKSLAILGFHQSAIKFKRWIEKHSLACDMKINFTFQTIDIYCIGQKKLFGLTTLHES